MVGKETTWTRKKKIVVGGVAALLAVALIGGGVARVLKMSGSQEDSGNVLTDTVQAGNISQTVTGAGSLASDKPVNVLVPADLEVVRVLVQEGDMVEVGTPIAEVSAASVQERQLAIEENIDSLQKQLDNLGWDTTHYELRKQVLEEQIADLRADRDAMIQLLETCTLTSDTAGEVGTVSLFEGVKTGKSSLRELQDKQQSVTQQDEGSQDGDSAQASQVSAAPGEGQAVTASMPTASMPTATVAVVRLDQSGPYAPTRIVADEGATDGEQANAKNTAEGQNSEDADANAFGSGNEDSNGETNEVSTENNEASNGDSEQSGGNDVPDSHAPEEIHGSIKLAVTPPVTGALPQDVLDLPEDTPYTAKITWAPEDEKFAPQTEYVCTVYLTAKDGYCFAKDPEKIDVSVPSSIAGKFEPLDLDNDGIAETLKVEAAFTATAAIEEKGAEQLADESIDLGGLGGGGYSVGDDDSSSLTKAGSSYSDTEAVALSVTPSEKVYLDVKIDELDILDVSIGQKAQVTIDAIPGETFTGTIVSIGDAEGKAQDGSSVKYAARIELPNDDRMRYGMSAKAVITVSEAKDAALVPIDAVTDIDGKTVVYTSVGEDGVLASPVTVKTGLSDGEHVQIVEGLHVGDTICYTPVTADESEESY